MLYIILILHYIKQNQARNNKKSFYMRPLLLLSFWYPFFVCAKCYLLKGGQLIMRLYFFDIWKLNCSCLNNVIFYFVKRSLFFNVKWLNSIKHELLPCYLKFYSTVHTFKQHETGICSCQKINLRYYIWQPRQNKMK